MFLFKSNSFKKLDKNSQIETFRKNAKLCVDYICQLTKDVPYKPVFPYIKPGYLRSRVPTRPPDESEKFKQMLDDFEKSIFQFSLHWKHPNMYAYFPCGNALPNIYGDMLSTAFGGVGFTWTSQPALTELENLMMDWLAHALHLPVAFIREESNGKGGGCTQSSSSECIFSVLFTARYCALESLGCSPHCFSSLHHQTKITAVLPKLVCYASTEAHSIIEKVANTALVKIHLVQTNDKLQVTGETLRAAIDSDLDLGLIPFFMLVTIGTPASCAVDDLDTIGPVCKEHKIWLHVEGSYGGNLFILPEMEHLRSGMDYVDSINISPNKLLLAAMDLACMWVRDINRYQETFHEIDTTHETEIFQKHKVEYRHYGLAMARRMRALKLWFLFRIYGVDGLKNYVRRTIKLAKHFETLISLDRRFEVTNQVEYGVICFRQKSFLDFLQINLSPGAPRISIETDCCRNQLSFCDEQNMNLLYRINKSRKIHLSPCIIRGQFNLRISVNNEFATKKDIEYAWGVIQSLYVTGIQWNVNDPQSSDILNDPLSFLIKGSETDTNNSCSLPISFGPIAVPTTHRSPFT